MTHLYALPSPSSSTSSAAVTTITSLSSSSVPSPPSLPLYKNKNGRYINIDIVDLSQSNELSGAAYQLLDDAEKELSTRYPELNNNVPPVHHSYFAYPAGILLVASIIDDSQSLSATSSSSSSSPPPHHAAIAGGGGGGRRYVGCGAVRVCKPKPTIDKHTNNNVPANDNPMSSSSTSSSSPSSLYDGLVEVKRMYVSDNVRGMGIARILLTSLESVARYYWNAKRVRLETGIRQPESIALYQSCGYTPINLYDEFIGDPLSRCFAKDL
jgi:GNAT superfamily N-acetyltransferase